MTSAEGKVWYRKITVMMNHLNSLTRPVFSASLQTVLVAIPVLCNCTGKQAFKPSAMHRPFFVGVGCLSLMASFIGYVCFWRLEKINKESLLLASSWNGRNGRGRSKRRKYRRLHDRRPDRHAAYGPLAWEIGPFFKIDHGATLDYLHNLVEYTFDANFLF